MNTVFSWAGFQFEGLLCLAAEDFPMFSLPARIRQSGNAGHSMTARILFRVKTVGQRCARSYGGLIGAYLSRLGYPGLSFRNVFSAFDFNGFHGRPRTTMGIFGDLVPFRRLESMRG